MKRNAKELIKAHFAATEDAVYFMDLCEALDLDLRTVVDACQELADEGVIGVAQEAH